VNGSTRDAVVVAGGGIVCRATPGGGTEVVVVHRPRYDDWSLPKGKVDPGESVQDCARREVLEETGLVVALGPAAPPVEYEDLRGRPKIVHYWYMTVVEDTGPRAPDDEVDACEWWPADRAARDLTYEHDRALVAALSTS
jgi:8-oxo-dGTP diphosphatase